MAEFVTKAERGRRIGVIIACAIILTAGIALGVIMYKKYDEIVQGEKKSNTLKALRTQIVQKEADLAKVRKEILDFGVHYGWQEVSLDSVSPRPGSVHDPEEVKKYLDWSVDELKRLGIDNYGKYSDSEGGGEPLTLVALFTVLEEKISALEKESKSLRKDIKELEVEYKAELTTQDNDSKEGFTKVAEQVEEYKGLMKRQNTDEEREEREMAEKEKNKNEKQQELTSLKKKILEEKRKEERKVADLSEQEVWLRHQGYEAQDRMDPDGKIIFVNQKLQTAWIDLTRKDRLFPGTNFQVYRSFQGGLKVVKGRVRVIKVEEGRSLVAIEDVYTDREIKMGDRLFSQLFEADRPRRVAFAGYLSGTISNSEAKRLLKKMGDVPMDVVDGTTDYVVAGDGYEDDPNWNLASKWGAKVLMERYLLDYLGVPY